MGLRNPRIEGQVQPYSINHNVTRGEWAVNDCQTCHNDQSRMTQPIKLAGTFRRRDAHFVTDTNVPASGEMYADETGALYYQPAPTSDNIYIFGNSRVSWVDWFGGLFFLGVLLGVGGHGTLRFVSSLRKPAHKHADDRKSLHVPQPTSASGTGCKPSRSCCCC